MLGGEGAAGEIQGVKGEGNVKEEDPGVEVDPDEKVPEEEPKG